MWKTPRGFSAARGPAGGLESEGRSDHARAVENTSALSGRRDMFLDERGTGLRVSWHPERDLVVLSVWQGDSCVGTFRKSVQDIPRLSGLLAAALGDWVDQTGGAPDMRSAAAETEAVGAGLSVQRRIRLSRPVLKLRGIPDRRRRGG
jgi:hypothetical protein